MPLARIAPGEIVDVPLFVILVQKNISAIGVVINFLIHGIAYLEKFRRPGDMDVLRTAHGDGLELFVPHYYADPAGSAGIGVLDGSHIDPVLTRQADCGNLGIGLFQLFFNGDPGFQGTFALKMAGIPDFNFVVVDPQINKIGGFSANNDFVVAGMLQFRSKKSAKQ